MNKQDLQIHAEEIARGFSGKIKKIEYDNNEIHLHIQDPRDAPEICNHMHAGMNGRLATIICTDERDIGNGFTIRYVFEKEREDVFVIIVVSLGDANSFPSIASYVYAASLYEREIMDMFGLVPDGNLDTRPLVLHEHWPKGIYPLRKEFNLKTKVSRHEGEYQFLRVEGDGICEIPVGPVHAGIIEPGHFRFSALGENIINLETRLFYAHKGIEKLAESKTPEDVVFLAERIAGDEAVANSTAYCQAMEKISRIRVPNRAKKIRTIFAELERAYNHIGTLGGMATDAGFAFGAARMNILKERMMQINENLCGSRILFGVNRLGGVRCEIEQANKKMLLENIDGIFNDFEKVDALLKSKASFMDRLKDTGKIPKKIARDLGIVGVAARCTGIDLDTRRDHPYSSYTVHNGKTPQQVIQDQIEMEKRAGDTMSRYEIRVKEVGESFDIIKNSLDLDTDGTYTEMPEKIEPFKSALGYTESHRGQAIHWVMTGESNSIFRYKIRTASFCNWQIIEHCVTNDILPDFPLVNKSLDLSYSGNDL